MIKFTNGTASCDELPNWNAKMGTLLRILGYSERAFD